MSTNERPTPETDAVTINIQPKHASVIKGIVPAFFARCLERERDEARDRIAQLETQLAEFQKSKESETFESHGLTWLKHTPGDPMPCNAEAVVRVLLRKELDSKDYAADDQKAARWRWGRITDKGREIIGWNYADAP